MQINIMNLCMKEYILRVMLTVFTMNIYDIFGYMNAIAVQIGAIDISVLKIKDLRIIVW